MLIDWTFLLVIVGVLAVHGPTNTLLAPWRESTRGALVLFSVQTWQGLLPYAGVMSAFVIVVAAIGALWISCLAGLGGPPRISAPE